MGGTGMGNALRVGAILLALDRPFPEEAIKTVLGWALTYHQDRRKPTPKR